MLSGVSGTIEYRGYTYTDVIAYGYVHFHGPLDALDTQQTIRPSGDERWEAFAATGPLGRCLLVRDKRSGDYIEVDPASVQARALPEPKVQAPAPPQPDAAPAPKPQRQVTRAAVADPAKAARAAEAAELRRILPPPVPEV